MDRVLIAGFSARAAAASAARAGFAVTAIDAFDDLDRHPAVRGLSLPRDVGVSYSAEAVAHAARSLECDAVVYLSNFENHPAAVERLAAGFTLWGNPPDVLRRVRDPLLLRRALIRRGFQAPAIRLNDSNDSNVSNGDWLIKPFASGGGRGIRRWNRERIPRHCYLQEEVSGVPGSIVFVAASGRVVPLGISRQLVGESDFGASGYQYCGNILAAAGDAQFSSDPAVTDGAVRLAVVVTEECGLVGVNGIDFMYRDGIVFPLEVNPRWCASMELVERAYGVSVFHAHAVACAEGALPSFDLQAARRTVGAYGKAIVFAASDLEAGETREWLRDDTVADVPHPRQRISKGAPICTVFATAADSADCRRELMHRARRVNHECATPVV